MGAWRATFIFTMSIYYSMLWRYKDLLEFVTTAFYDERTTNYDEYGEIRLRYGKYGVLRRIIF